jgi:wyosine [tRNA(Phe)-imidazoG37] synthetase (radical SAM superfamily)
MAILSHTKRDDNHTSLADVFVLWDASLAFRILFNQTSPPSLPPSGGGGKAELSPQRGELERGENVCLELCPSATFPSTTNTSSLVGCPLVCYTPKRDMGILPLETGIVYGPIRSRRLGLSLGVNLLPTDYKLCSFDCVYCHYGRTDVKSLTGDAHDLPWSSEVLREVRAALRKYPNADYITFSGNGEPTLHPAFPKIAAEVRELRDKLAPNVKLALFSNATTAHLAHVREALALFDLPMLKLDAGDPQALAAINRPAPEVIWECVVEGLGQVPNLVIQSVLIDGEVSNVKGAAFKAWGETLARLKPARVQIYSTDYPVPESGVERVLPYELQRIAEEVRERTGLLIETHWF